MCLYFRTSVRSLGVYSVNKTSITIKSEVAANISPATLVPYFDPDTRLVFLSGKVSPALFPFLPSIDMLVCRGTRMCWPMSMCQQRAPICLKLLHLLVVHHIKLGLTLRIYMTLYISRWHIFS